MRLLCVGKGRFTRVDAGRSDMRKAPGMNNGKPGARGNAPRDLFAFLWALYTDEAQCSPMASTPSAVPAAPEVKTEIRESLEQALGTFCLDGSVTADGLRHSLAHPETLVPKVLPPGPKKEYYWRYVASVHRARGPAWKELEGAKTGELRVAGFTTFRLLWGQVCSKLLRTSKFHRHAECDKCHELKTLMRRSTTAAEKARYATMFLDHQEAQTLDRRMYDEAIAMSKLGKLLCIAQDGSDQERYRVFRAMRIPKSMEALENPTPRLKLLGSWAHAVVGCFYLVEEDVRKDSRLTVEALFTTIEECRLQLARQGKHLPPELWIQVDNASSENKNQHVFMCVAALIAKHVFKAATIAFLSSPYLCRLRSRRLRGRAVSGASR